MNAELSLNYCYYSTAGLHPVTCPSPSYFGFTRLLGSDLNKVFSLDHCLLPRVLQPSNPTSCIDYACPPVQSRYGNVIVHRTLRFVWISVTSPAASKDVGMLQKMTSGNDLQKEQCLVGSLHCSSDLRRALHSPDYWPPTLVPPDYWPSTLP